jgi:dihydroorotase
MKLLIKNGTVVNENQLLAVDLLIENGKFIKIEKNILEPADQIIDASGLHILPGIIDDQVHFREPGMTHKGEIRTETMAAVAGGVTSVMDMPNTKPLAITNDILEKKYQRAKDVALCNYSFYLGASNDNIEEIKKVNPKTVCGIKVFMGSSTGNMLVDNPETLNQLFKEAPILVATHCEDTPTITENEEKSRKKYGEDVPIDLHGEIRSREACLKSSSLAVELAKKHGTKLHVLHLTTADEMQLFSTEKLENKNITAEVCVHHLTFNNSDYDSLGTKIKCNPAIKTENDRKALFQALIDGKLDVIGTDHAPHTADEKNNKYFKAPSGIPLVQHHLLSLLEFFQDGLLDLGFIVEKASHAVADLFQIKNRGYIRKGYFADLAIVDLLGETKVDEEKIYSKCGWSPFEGKTFRSRIKKTIINGEIVFDEGQINEDFHGMRLEFNRK